MYLFTHSKKSLLRWENIYLFNLVYEVKHMHLNPYSSLLNVHLHLGHCFFMQFGKIFQDLQAQNKTSKTNPKLSQLQTNVLFQLGGPRYMSVFYIHAPVLQFFLQNTCFLHFKATVTQFSSGQYLFSMYLSNHMHNFSCEFSAFFKHVDYDG